MAKNIRLDYENGGEYFIGGFASTLIISIHQPSLVLRIYKFSRSFRFATARESTFLFLLVQRKF
jgi:hypothetical protein